MVLESALVSFFYKWLTSFPSTTCYYQRNANQNHYEVPFHAKMGSIKDRNSMDLTEAEGIKKRGYGTGTKTEI